MVVSKEKTTVLLKCYAVGPKPGGQQVCGMDKNTRMGRLQARHSSFSAQFPKGDFFFCLIPPLKCIKQYKELSESKLFFQFACVNACVCWGWAHICLHMQKQRSILGRLSLSLSILFFIEFFYTIYFDHDFLSPTPPRSAPHLPIHPTPPPFSLSFSLKNKKGNKKCQGSTNNKK